MIQTTDLGQSLTRLFERQVRQHGNCTALLTPTATWTYAGLDAWSNTIAHAIFRGVGPGKEPICLCHRQGALSVAATLGVLKTGRPYVPLDPNTAPGDWNETVRATQAPAVLCAPEMLEPWTQAMGGSLLVLATPLQPDKEVICPVHADVHPDDLACIFFTSGTTGAPKGVMDSHRNVVHNVLRYTETLGINSADRLTMIQSPVFSGTVSSKFSALLNGAALLPFDLQTEGPLRLAEWLVRSRATIYHSVPSIFRSVVASGSKFNDVRVVRLEGDAAAAADLALMKAAFNDRAILANGLGTTETGLVRQTRYTARDHAPAGPLSIGGAVPGVEMRIVDEQGRPLPAGTIGEIEVRSRYLAPGYWRNEDLTAQRFHAEPGTPGIRYYRTGDLGTMDARGAVDIIGRKDGSFKVNGQWAAPATVEQALLETNLFDQVLVVANGRDPRASPIAYLVVKQRSRWDPVELHRALAAKLPAHALPGAFVAIDRIPYTEHGKVDRSKLPVPDSVLSGFVAPQTEGQQQMAAIWEEVLGEGKIGLNDHFFLRGGDSLSASTVAAKARQLFQLAVDAKDLLLHPVLADWMNWLEQGAIGGQDVAKTELKPPVFCVDWPGGHGWELAGLAHLLAHERKLHCIPSCGMDDPWLRETDIRIIAESTLAKIRALHPEGPFVLAGNCYGAIVAMEAAGLLQKRDGYSGTVLLLQVGPRDFPTLVPKEDLQRSLRDDRRRHLGALWTSARQRSMRYALPEIGQVLLRKVGAAGLRLLQRIPLAGRMGRTQPLPIYRAARMALHEHKPETFHGRVSLFLSERAVQAYTNAPHRTWAGLADNVRLHFLPGSTDKVITKENEVVLARLIMQELE